MRASAAVFALCGGADAAGPTPAPPAVRYHCDSAGWKCVEAAAGHSTKAKCAAACVAPVVPTVEIAAGVNMPMISLGTCCGSNPSVGLGPWLDASGSAPAYGGAGIDTAYDYNDQPAIAKVLKSKGADASKLFITTKVPGGSDSGAQTLQKVQDDLKQLGVSQVDLVLLHSPRGGSKNKEQYKALEQALAQNLTRSIGVSNFNQAQIEALDYTVKPAVNQCSMNVKSHDDKTIAYCQKEGITYEAFYAMKGCDFSSATLQKIGDAHNKTVSQVCLRYILDRGAVMAVGTGSDASKAASYSRENLEIFDFKLSATELDTINKM